MLLEFSVGNFRSFNEKRTLSLIASGISDFPGNIVKTGKYKVVRSAAIYGANSSGKSNLIKAILLMKYMVLNSVKLNDNEELSFDPFLLAEKSGENPTHFEIMFLIGNIRYRYGFEYNRQLIVEEWLFTKENSGSEKELFIRTKDGIGVSKTNFKDALGYEEKTNDNRLFLSLTAQLGIEISKTIIDWFRVNCKAITGINSDGYQNFSKLMFHEKKDGHRDAMQLLKLLKLGFESISTTETEFDESLLPDDMSPQLRAELIKELKGGKRLDLYTIHNIYDKKGNIVGEKLFDAYKRESDGTKKLIDLSGPVFDALLNGKVLVIDELDVKMHPLISQYIVELFNDPKRNTENAQLIFTTHDTHLLSSKLLRRDQIWFTEKDSVEQTDLYSMMDIEFPDGSKPRNDSNYEKNYIDGRYGAIPYITHY